MGQRRESGRQPHHLADDSGLGFLGGAALIGGLLLLVLGATCFTRINRVLLFWVAFVLTRPFWATLGDLLTEPVAKGGLDVGTIGSSAILAGVLAAFMVYTSIRHLAPAVSVDRASKRPA